MDGFTLYKPSKRDPSAGVSSDAVGSMRCGRDFVGEEPWLVHLLCIARGFRGEASEVHPHRR